ncbi:MAG: hypothetical protein OXD31_07370 [Chloroflexi bacterium]|nr:hypothetical protein [Chloroflexota bacterium]
MDKGIIELWADIGSEEYWKDLPRFKSGQEVPFSEIYIPFRDRWPQPGFIGKSYFKLPKRKRVVVIAQNPRSYNTRDAETSDMRMFDLIRTHSNQRSDKSLQMLFVMMRKFLLGIDGHGPAWTPVKDVERHFALTIDEIAYLNIIPLATVPNSNGDERIDLATFGEAYKRSTKLQLELLMPNKILIFGAGPHTQFKKWQSGIDQLDFKYVKRRRGGDIDVEPKRFAQIREWLKA